MAKTHGVMVLSLQWTHLILLPVAGQWRFPLLALHPVHIIIQNTIKIQKRNKTDSIIYLLFEPHEINDKNHIISFYLWTLVLKLAVAFFRITQFLERVIKSKKKLNSKESTLTRSGDIGKKMLQLIWDFSVEVQFLPNI